MRCCRQGLGAANTREEGDVALTSLMHAGLVALVVLLAACGAGRCLLPALRVTARDAEAAWLATVAGLGSLSLAVLSAGLLGLLRPWFVVPVGLLALVGALEAARLLVRCGPLLMRAWTEAGWGRRLAAGLLAAVTASTLAWSTLAYGLLPSVEWDELAYHLAVPKLYVRAGGIAHLPFIPQSNWPLNSEMLSTLALLMGSDVASHLINIGIVALTGAGLLLVARSHGAARVGLLAAALYVTTPLVQRLAGTAMADLGAPLYVLAGLAALQRGQREERQAWFAVAGACFGFAAGCKLTAGAFLPLGLGLLLAAGWRRRGPRGSTLFRAAVIFTAAATLAAGPWYLRSFVYTGNPVFPFAYALFGGRDWDELAVQNAWGSVRLWNKPLPISAAGLAQSLLLLLTRPGRLGTYGGLGLLVPVGALAAALAPSRLARRALFLVGAFYLVWFAVGSHQLRLLLPVVSLAALAAATGFVALHDRVGLRPARTLLACLLAVPLAQAWPWARPQDLEQVRSAWPYVAGRVSRETWLLEQTRAMPLFQFVNKELPEDARVLMLPYENRGFYLDRDYVWGNPLGQRLIRFERFATPGELALELRRLGVTHVLESHGWLYTAFPQWRHFRRLTRRLEDECAQELFRHEAGAVYALGACRPVAPSLAADPS